MNNILFWTLTLFAWVGLPLIFIFIGNILYKLNKLKPIEILGEYGVDDD